MTPKMSGCAARCEAALAKAPLGSTLRLPPDVRYRLENQSAVPQQRRALCDFRCGFAARCEAGLAKSSFALDAAAAPPDVRLVLQKAPLRSTLRLPPDVRYRLENQSAVPQQRRALCDCHSGFAFRSSGVPYTAV